MTSRRIVVFFILFLGFGNFPLYPMSTVKGWINAIRPETFEIDDTASDDTVQKGELKFTESQVRVLTALKKREEELRIREEIHQRKANELKSLAQQIEQKLDQMRKLTATLEKKRQFRKEMDEKNISRMVKYYESMDPELTAIFFNRMDRMTAMHILMRMNPRKASAVMQLLDPNVAVEITENVSGFKTARQERMEK